MYKLYRKPLYKIFDILGLGFLAKNSYNEFWALRDISLTITKGEKVAFIGRNGAGKSTLLKIIAGNVPYNSGEMAAHGMINALFTLGTGFHPDFSGRENIFASLAYQGVVGREAQKKYHEIVEFSELEEFILNPVKTYSAGMYARLAFSVATTIEPDILIIDEVLGVGDAYFNSKAIERMKDLTGSGTTVLFVTHDLASAQRLCDRAFWLDKGRIVMDSDILSVMKAYAAEIRKQEEIRLKAKSMMLSRKSLALEESARSVQLLFHLVTEQNRAPRKGLPVHQINFLLKGELIESIKVGDTMDNDIDSAARIITEKTYINWTEPFKIENLWVRAFKNTGGRYVHAPFILDLPSYYGKEELSMEITYQDVINEKIKVEIYDGTRNYHCLGSLEAEGDGKWKKGSFIIDSRFVQKEEVEETETKPGVSEEKVIDIDGSGKLSIQKAYFSNCNEEMKFIFNEGEVFSLVVEFQIHHPLPDFPYFIYTAMNEQGIYVDNWWEKLDIKEQGSYRAVLTFSRIPLKRGRYFWSLSFVKEIDELDTSKPWPYYLLWDRKLELTIVKESFETINRGIISLDPMLQVAKLP